MRKSFAAAIMLLLTLSLTACDPGKSGEKPADTPTATAIPTGEPAATETPAPTATSIEEPPATPTEQPADRESGNYKITLSGKRDEHTLIDRFCYIEGDNYFLLLEKGLDLPGDFAINVGLIVDALEQETGLSFNCPESLPGLDCSTVCFGYDPWRDLDFGKKPAIYVFVDNKDEALLSYALNSACVFYDYSFISWDIWNSVPSYKNNAYRRRDFFDYSTLAHELAHTLTLRYATYSDIICEGSADYFAEKVLQSLSDKSADLKESLAHMFLSDRVSSEITSENAEAVFIDDYTDLSHADRGDQYTLGRQICIFLEQTYGKSFFKDYAAALTAAGYPMASGFPSPTIDEAALQKHAEIMKNLFGDDVFVRFGKWYSEGR